MAHKVLVIGGAGYIGSHMVRKLQESGDEPVVFDNLSTGHRHAVPQNVRFIKGDLNQNDEIAQVFENETFDAVMHFAASSLVGESVTNPLKYYGNNVSAFVNLLRAMVIAEVKSIVFSSTAAVFGEPAQVPIHEDTVKKPTNPYGRSKLMIEQMLEDAAAYGLRYVILRYFNAAGAHGGGEIGEEHTTETHLIPNILNSLLEKNGKPLTIFGLDYPTPDGTCVRDYIHVDDLCEAHRLSLLWLQEQNQSNVFNLGSGTGYSIREIITETEKITGLKVSFCEGERRAGDPPRLIASSTKAETVLGWRAKKTLHDILETAWQWHKNLKART